MILNVIAACDTTIILLDDNKMITNDNIFAGFGDDLVSYIL